MFQLMVACGKCFLQLNFILLFLCRFAAYIWLHIRLACCTPVLLRTRFVLFLSPPHYPELGFYYRSFSKPFAFLLRPMTGAPFALHHDVTLGFHSIHPSAEQLLQVYVVAWIAYIYFCFLIDLYMCIYSISIYFIYHFVC